MTLIVKRPIQAAFTLVELLVVLGIIVILLGILIPTVSSIRRIAYASSTQNEISNIANAITSYHNDFGAYPGPLSNDQIELGTPIAATPPTPPTNLFLTYSIVAPATTPTYSAIPQPWTVTGSENLVLGLLGGLRISPGVPSYPAFAPTEVGLGPLSLNPLNPHRNAPYLAANSGNQSYLWTGWNPQNPAPHYAPDTGGTAGDSEIPEFVDRFPNSMPILYLRARTGARGILSDGTITLTDPATGQPALYQYDLRDILPYTDINFHLGLNDNAFHNLTKNLNTPDIAFNGKIPPKGISGLLSPPTYNNTAGLYFSNPTTPPTDNSSALSWNATGRPRQVDQYILISAGPDGIYGTADDETSFGDVTQ
ncbi:MAG: prepilin-type N-terminal cleavage/methylation domain-containing protein [Planctomycetota bacterium]|nr:prepilin-type N-terminal cleavage/methylation domain-containing protein [Planctomycetota bacterium]